MVNDKATTLIGSASRCRLVDKYRIATVSSISTHHIRLWLMKPKTFRIPTMYLSHLVIKIAGNLIRNEEIQAKSRTFVQGLDFLPLSSGLLEQKHEAKARAVVYGNEECGYVQLCNLQAPFYGYCTKVHVIRFAFLDMLQNSTTQPPAPKYPPLSTLSQNISESMDAAVLFNIASINKTPYFWVAHLPNVPHR